MRSYLVKVTKKIPKGEIFYYVFGSWEVREFREIKEVRERDGGFEGRVVLMWRLHEKATDGECEGLSWQKVVDVDARGIEAQEGREEVV